MTPPTSGHLYLTIVIKPFRQEAVLRALRPFNVLSVTASEVRGYGRQKGHLELYRGSEYVLSFIPKVKLEVVIPESEAEEAFDSVQLAARTGRIGDGKIFVQKVPELHSDDPPASD